MAKAIVFRGGTVLDGTGTDRRLADVRIDDGKVTAVGDVDLTDAEVIDVDGLFVAPGFIDPHTHLDAQVLWDPDVTPSTWHGITSVVIGNCGFGIAPTKPADRELIARILENVEGMPIEALQAGIDWQFESFPEYLDVLRSKALRVNVAALVGHTPVRVFVMGAAANERAATAEEVAEMCAITAEALDAGAVGFATSRARNHQGAYGAPVPSRLADRAELAALLATLASVDEAVFQVVAGPDLEAPEDFARVAAAGTPVTWTPFFADGTTAQKLEMTKQLGGEVWPQMACRPIVTQLTMSSPAIFYSLPSFAPVLAAPIEQRAAIYLDPEWRARALPEANQRWTGRWDKLRVKETNLHTHLIDGPSLGQLAAASRIEPFFLMLDLALAENLETRFELSAYNDDDAEVAQLLQDPATFLGLSDAGAHVREICDAGYATHLLGVWVRERGSISWEEAVWRLTGHPAEVFRLDGKGRLAPGFDADIVVFDPETVAAKPSERVHDLPAGADRLVARSVGIRHVLVNGEPTRLHGDDIADARPGRVISRADRSALHH